MPLVVGELLNEMLDFVSAWFGRTLPITELPGLCPQLAAVRPLRLVHVPVGVRLMDGQSFKGLACSDLGNVAGSLCGTFQLASKRGRKCTHKMTGPSFSCASTCSRTFVNHCSSSVPSWMVAPGSTIRTALGSMR